MKTLNLCEILKNCPLGTKLYSPILGEVMFIRIEKGLHFPILVKKAGDASRFSFTEKGHYVSFEDAECLLFPSKENHNWSTFQVPKPKPKFKPFDQVLVRDEVGQKWGARHFANYSDNEDYPYECTNGVEYAQCVPYEGNEHLYNTNYDVVEG